jgi:hypothetical protein
MNKTMKTLEYDLRYLQAGLEVLVDYLLSDEVFWPLSVHPPEGEPDYPSLTLGGLLLSRAKLAAYQKFPTQMDQVDQLNTELNLIRSKWRVAWEKKAERSFEVRLRMWRDFIKEYKNNPQDNTKRYSHEVRLRAMLNLLQSEGGGTNNVAADLLSGLDGYLKSVLVLDGFLWEPGIQAGFPADVHWYLYGYLPPGVKAH